MMDQAGARPAYRGIILVNLPRGEHKVLIEVVDPEGGVLTAQTVTFKSPGK